MRKNYRCIPLLLFILLGLISCKKDTLNITKGDSASTSEISAAKDWYETQLKTAKVSAKTNIGFLKQQLAWEQMVNVEKDYISLIPFNISDAKNNKAYLELLKNEKGEIVSAKYVFLLSNEFVDNTKAQGLLMNKQNIDNFSGAKIEYDLNNNLLISTTFKSGVEDKNVVAKVEMKNVPEVQNRSIDGECQEQVCVAWYWVIYNVETGQIYSAAYMYTSCYCGGIVDTGGGDQIQPGVARTKNQIYEVFRRENSPGSPERWYMTAACTTTGVVFANTQNNTFTTITNPTHAAIFLISPPMGGPFLPPPYPPSTWYCSMSSPTYNLSVNGQTAIMTTTCILTYAQQNNRTEFIQKGHTWDARTDLF
jgi:hypothetical protein